MVDKVLITGGAGFIGCALAPELIAAGCDVVALDNLHPQVHTRPGLPTRLPRLVHFVPGDVATPPTFQALFKYFKPDVVVHLAAETGTGQSLTEAGRHASVNVCGTANLLDALTAVRHIPREFLLCSSRAVYGDGAWMDGAGAMFYPPGRSNADLKLARWDYRGPQGEPAKPQAHVAGRTQPNPTSIYGATKLAQEHLLAAWCRAFGSRLTVLRLQNVYGPGQSLGNPYTGVLTLFARMASEGKQLDIYEDGEIIRDFVYVSDVVGAMMRALQSRGEGVRTYDIGSGKPTTIATVARHVACALGAPEPLITGRFRDGDVRAAFCSIEAAQRDLGYSPGISLDEGLAALVRSLAHEPR